MALHHKWNVKNGFAYVLQFFSLISDGLGGVESLSQVLQTRQGRSAVYVVASIFCCWFCSFPDKWKDIVHYCPNCKVPVGVWNFSCCWKVYVETKYYATLKLRFEHLTFLKIMRIVSYSEYIFSYFSWPTIQINFRSHFYVSIYQETIFHQYYVFVKLVFWSPLVFTHT